MKKRITRLSVFSVILLIAILIALPHVMENKVGIFLKENVNNKIAGQFDFSRISLSLYKDFPNATIRLEQPSIANLEPFRGDTLFSAEWVELKLSIVEFLEGTDDPIEIKEFRINNAALNLLLTETGMANYDIAKPSASVETAGTSEENTIFALNSYEIVNSEIIYWDRESNIKLELLEFNHSGSGKFSAESSELLTETQALISFFKDDKPYLEENNLLLTAFLGIDLETNTYTFRENKAVLNKLPIEFKGMIRAEEEATDMDLSFSTINSDFRNFLAMIPAHYTRDISQLETVGNFDLSGKIKGKFNEETIPEFSLEMNAVDASFKFPELRKKVEHIHIDALVTNTTGIAEDTEIHIENAGFQIDKDTFQISARITELLGNTNVNSNVKGRVDLQNLAQAYPMPSDMAMEGLLQADISSSFNMEAIENKDYKNIRLAGLLNVKGLNYDFTVLPNPLRIHTLEADLDSKTIHIRELAGISGETDFSATGKLENIMGYLFNEEVLSGDFDMRSNSFVVADLIHEESEDAEGSDSSSEGFKVPPQLNFNLKALVGKAIYDDIIMYDLAGMLRIKDEVISFTELSSRMLDGRLAADGTVSTKGEKPSFEMALDMSKINIAKTFGTIDLVSVIAPALQAMDGRINSKIALSGSLTDQLDLDLNTLSGNILAEILSARVNPEKTPVLNKLNSKLDFANLSDLDISGLKTALSFEDGQVKVKPFTIHYDDISIDLSGGHSFTSGLNYQMDFEVPASYLGDNVNKLLAGIGDESLKDLRVPVIAKLGGTYDKPNISTDLKNQTRVITDQLVEIQKEKYLNKGKKEVGLLINNVLTSSKDDSSGSELSDSKVASESSDQDSSNKSGEKEIITDKVIKEKAGKLLGGILGSKNRAVTVKDTLN